MIADGQWEDSSSGVGTWKGRNHHCPGHGVFRSPCGIVENGRRAGTMAEGHGSYSGGSPAPPPLPCPQNPRAPS